MAPSGKHNILDLVSRSELLLKCDELIGKCATVLFWNALEGVFKENLGAVILPLPNLKLSEVDEELFVKRALAQLS